MKQVYEWWIDVVDGEIEDFDLTPSADWDVRQLFLEELPSEHKNKTNHRVSGTVMFTAEEDYCGRILVNADFYDVTETEIELAVSARASAEGEM